MTLEATVKKYRALFASKPAVLTAHDPKRGHFYVSPNDPVPYHSVTYYTSFIKDPSIRLFLMNRAMEFMKDELARYYDPSFSGYKISKELFEDLLKQAKLAPEGEFQNAGDIGTAVHKQRELWFQVWIESGMVQLTDDEIDKLPMPDNCDPEVISGCRAIKRFLKETGYIPVACELALVDDELKVGGTIDDLGVFPNPEKVPVKLDMANTDFDPEDGLWMEGGYKIKYHPYLTFVDLKTSNQGKKPAYAYQVRGFYQRMIRKTFNLKPKKTYILHTSKEDGTYKLINLTDMKFLEKDAEYLVHCSRSWDKVVEAFKPKVITI